jgi:hypothetical protein
MNVTEAGNLSKNMLIYSRGKWDVGQMLGYIYDRRKPVYDMALA